MNIGEKMFCLQRPSFNLTLAIRKFMDYYLPTSYVWVCSQWPGLLG